METLFFRIAMVAIGGALGSVFRYLVTISPIAKTSSSIPLATFLINLLGSFLIGFIFVFLEIRFPENIGLRLFILVGFLGGFTTFSTFEFEIWNLVDHGKLMNAFIYVLASVLLGFIGVVLGISIGRKFG